MEKRRITELDGLRVLMIFVVSWYHIWQQSWLEPVIAVPAVGIRWSLDWLVRSGYVWVDGTVLLSAFLLYLPLTRQGRSELKDIGDFYFRKAKRLLPGFWFILLVFFFGMCLPWGLYKGDGPYMAKDLFTHFTLIFPFWRDTYIWTPLGAAPWTLSLVAQGYLLFPLLAKGMKKNPWWTLAILIGLAFGFRAWCIWALNDYAMVVNCLANFLDVYAIGFASALLFAKLEKSNLGKRVQRDSDKKNPEERDQRTRGSWGRFMWSPANSRALPDSSQGDHENRPRGPRTVCLHLLATIIFFGCLIGVCEMLKLQARSSGQVAIQEHQMMYRPVFALGFAGMILSAPFMLKPLRWLLGNRVMVFLSSVSMSYYLIHQTLAVHLKRMGWPPSLTETPNMAGEQPWQSQYTAAAFLISLAAAIFVTYVVEKPVGKWLEKRRAKKKAA